MRYLLPNNKIQVKLYAFDILNRNSGVNRTADVNYVQEEVFRTLTRYVMLSVGYSIQGFQKQQSGMMGPPGGGRGMMR
jgi:hydrogenase maturation factor